MPADPHLSDEQLLDRYFDASDEDERAAVHLFRCGACAERLRAITGGLEEDYARERAAADRYFTPARLEAQRAHVLDRLAQPREARVIAFPAAQAPAAPHVPLRRPSRLAASAAALLLFAGGLTGWRLAHEHQPRMEQTDARLGARAHRAADERLLSEVEGSLVNSQIAALQPLDAITPMEGR
jgi:hypothetical protein